RVYAFASAAGVTAYVGSYDHRLYALSQATGRIRWTFDAGAPVSGAPTVLGGLVYFSTCGSCSSLESNPRARRTFAVDARTGPLGRDECRPPLDGRAVALLDRLAEVDVARLRLGKDAPRVLERRLGLTERRRAEDAVLGVQRRGGIRVVGLPRELVAVGPASG